MPTKRGTSKPEGRGENDNARLRIQGHVQLEELEGLPSDLKVTAFVNDSQGRQLGQALVDANGNFEIPITRAKEPFDGELVIGPSGDPKTVRGSALYHQSFSKDEWKGEQGTVLQRSVFLPRLIWWPWWPWRICITGHVRKISFTPSGWETCPVPFAKVEIFDVDREACWWPPIYRW